MKKKYTINGKYLTQKITGVQRYANEIVNELDELVTDNKLEIVVPNNTNISTDYNNINIVHWGLFHGSLWEQISYPLYLILKHRIGINFASPSLLKPDYAYMHDITFQRNPNYCNKVYYIYICLIGRAIVRHAKKIFTVSNFSKHEIQAYYNIPGKEITVVYNAWQHIDRIQADETIFNKNPLIRKGEYIFSLSSLSQNKNHQWIIENAVKNPSKQYIIAGGMNKQIFGDVELGVGVDNIHYLGYVCDAEAKALMTHAKAFLFPTFYEGFGIPPLEALSCGTKIIVSDTPCMKEVYEDAAYYIDPYNSDVDIDELMKENVADAKKILDKYSWKKSAKQLYQSISGIIK